MGESKDGEYTLNFVGQNGPSKGPLGELRDHLPASIKA